mgnify:CR=1 FL=1
MATKVKIPTQLRSLTGGAEEVDASGATLAELIDDLFEGGGRDGAAGFERTPLSEAESNESCLGSRDFPPPCR